MFMCQKGYFYDFKIDVFDTLRLQINLKKIEKKL